MSSVISVNQNIMHGQPCFAGTRVTISSLFDHLEGGYTIDDFLKEFPTVTHEQVTSLLSELRDEVLHRDTAA